MISLFRRAPATRAGRRLRVVLRLDGFERRDTPSADPVAIPGQTAPTGGPTSTTDGQPPPATNNPPEIVNFSADPMGDGWYVISGHVIDEHPGGLTVTFDGNVATMNGRTTTTDADGNFSVLVCLKTDGTDTGWLLATTHDDAGQVSNEASDYVSP